MTKTVGRPKRLKPRLHFSQERVSVYMTSEMKSEIDKHAERANLQTSTLLRRILDEWLQGQMVSLDA